MSKVKEKLTKKIQELKDSEDRCLGLRASYGRGYKGTTDRLLQDAENYASQARDLQKILNELDEE